MRNLTRFSYKGKFGLLHYLQKQPNHVKSYSGKLYGYLNKGTKVQIYADNNLAKQVIHETGWYGIRNEQDAYFKSIIGSSDMLERISNDS